MLALISYCNDHYRYVKFVMDDDNDVLIEYDTPETMQDDCVGQSVFEIFVRMKQIADDCYPLLMKIIWT